MKNSNKTKRQIIPIIVLTILATVAVLVIGLHIYYYNRWYPDTTFNNVKVSGMTYDKSVSKVQQAIDSYELVIVGRNNEEMTVKASDIGLGISSDDIIEEAYQRQHKTSVLLTILGIKDPKQTIEVSYSRNRLDQILAQSALEKGSNTYKIIKPKNAKLVFSKEKNVGIIQKEILGNTLNQGIFRQQVITSIETLTNRLNLADQNKYPKMYQAPKRYSTNAELKNTLTSYNQHILRWMNWNLGNQLTDVFGPEQLQDCVNIRLSKGKVTWNQKKITKLVEDFCLKYKTQGMTRIFRTHNKKKIKVSGGDYGWRIDYDKVLSQTKKMLSTDISQDTIDQYVKDPSDQNRKALTKTFATTYTHKAYQMNTSDKSKDWDQKNYSEVDLTAQKVYVYRKGKKVFSCECITGRATKDRITRTGFYDVKEKRLTKTLTGPDYSVPTKYWTRIMWTGTGYHYASRGDWGSWSPTYYRTAGSHGCVNLTLSNAKSIYKLTKIGDPVIIHY